MRSSPIFLSKSKRSVIFVMMGSPHLHRREHAPKRGRLIYVNVIHDPQGLNNAVFRLPLMFSGCR
jgi:hypothetical protein